jgi:hypothetical protein
MGLTVHKQEDVARLFAQRTEETGQRITQEALDYVYEQSRGQPWIVNSLFMRATMRVLEGNRTPGWLKVRPSGSAWTWGWWR